MPSPVPDITTKPTTQPYQPRFQSAADANAFQGITNDLQSTNYPATNYPDFYKVVQSILGGTGYNRQGQTDASNNLISQGNQLFGDAGTARSAAGPMFGAANTLIGAANPQIMAGQSLIPYSKQILDTGFDPQEALRNREFQRQQEQGRAGMAARGIGTSPYGQQLETQGNQNFDIDWQNAQLARQAQAAQAAGGLVGAAGTALGAGTNAIGGAGAATGAGVGALTGAGGLVGQGGNAISTGSQLGQSIPAFDLSSLGLLNQAGAQALYVPQQGIQDLLAYMNQGTGAANAATSLFGTQANAQNLGYQDASSFWKDIGKGIGTGANYLGF